ncbi:LytR family transcriptional regulator [Puteibacter caeruleilacunae]|nr:LytR family transcriptional regulator [Puteibacter caeruleilacunae]
MRYPNERRPVNYRRRKIIFISIVCFLCGIAVYLLFPKPEFKSVKRFTTAGLCGCVNKRAVYRLPVGSDLASLIAAGHGLRPSADVSRIDFDHIIQQDSVYHIPCRGYELDLDSAVNALPDVIRRPEDEKKITVLYIGFPAVYFLVTYYPTKQYISVMYLPHSTVMLSNEYRLMDVYFTLGLEKTVEIVEKKLGYQIDYYFTQNRETFISMVDKLNGVYIDVDSDYARAYGRKTGVQELDGFHAWEYIRFINKENYRSKGKKSKKSLEHLQLETNNLDLAYQMRQMRQKKMIAALRKRFNQNSPIEQVNIVREIVQQLRFNSNLTVDVALELASSVGERLQVRYGTLPGHYQKKEDRWFYIPDQSGKRILNESSDRETFKNTNETQKQILY